MNEFKNTKHGQLSDANKESLINAINNTSTIRLVVLDSRKNRTAVDILQRDAKAFITNNIQFKCYVDNCTGSVENNEIIFNIL